MGFIDHIRFSFTFVYGGYFNFVFSLRTCLLTQDMVLTSKMEHCRDLQQRSHQGFFTLAWIGTSTYSSSACSLLFSFRAQPCTSSSPLGLTGSHPSHMQPVFDKVYGAEPDRLLGTLNSAASSLLVAYPKFQLLQKPSSQIPVSSAQQDYHTLFGFHLPAAWTGVHLQSESPEKWPLLLSFSYL